MTDTQLIIRLTVCGAIIVLSVFLLAVLRRRPKRSEKALIRKECLRAEGELHKLEKCGENGEEKKLHGTKILRSLNYAKRLAQQLAYEDENGASSAVLDKVSECRELAGTLRKVPGAERPELCRRIGELFGETIRLIDEISETEKQVKGK